MGRTAQHGENDPFPHKNTVSLDPYEGVPPRPTSTKEFCLARPLRRSRRPPGGTHWACSDISPGNGECLRSKGGYQTWPREVRDVRVPRLCTGRSGRWVSPRRPNVGVACPLHLTPSTVDEKTCATSGGDRTPYPTMGDVAVRRESRPLHAATVDTMLVRTDKASQRFSRAWGRW